MTINEYFKTKGRDTVYKDLYPTVICADGYSVSVQASRYHYCRPRVDDAETYTAVELGFPNMPDELIYEYAEGSGSVDYTDTVYGYVPVEVVDALIEKHGGIANI